MIAHETDVLVVGMGPAGASAAMAAARAGLRVLALERRREIGVPVQCAEWIPLPLGAWAQAEGVLQQRIAGMTTCLPSGAVSHADFPGLMIDRATFDRALAAEAQAQGAALSLGCALLALDPATRRARVRSAEGEFDVRYRAVIAADGPRSTVARCLGLPALATVHTRQYTVPLASAQQDTDVWLADDYAGGYAWLFPKGPLANLGVGGDATLDLKQVLDTLHRELVDAGRVGDEVMSRTGGEIPVSGLREQLVMDETLFAGDAAGLTHPITGAGIAAAVVSGERAGEAAAAFLHGDAKALREYEFDIRDQYEASLRRAVDRRNLLWRGERGSNPDAAHRRGWVAFEEYFAK